MEVIPLLVMTNSVLLEVDKSSSKQSIKEQRGFFYYISCYHSPKPYIYILLTIAIFFIVFQIQALTPIPEVSPPSWSSSWGSFSQHWERVFNNTCSLNDQLKAMAAKLRDSVTFLPLKDLRYRNAALDGHTWFMSSMNDLQQQGEVQFQHFPSQASQSRLLCIKGQDTHDGSWNSYALAWPDTLPYNATLLKGLTFISYNHYNYANIWHGLSAVVPFVAWHQRMGECTKPTRWILYHWGELRMGMGSWLTQLMEATFGGGVNIETFEGINGPACFEEAVVMRHNEGGMSRDRRLEVYDEMRCKAKVYCNVSSEGSGAGVIAMTVRTGARSFRNESEVIKIFEKECLKVDGCKIKVAHSNNLSFCEQWSSTDILVSPHGAQLTNMFLMDRNSSVMEFFPKGWLKLAGVGQYVYHWIATWSRMRHQGAWRDPNGDPYPFPVDDRRCFSIFKDGLVGYNETYFGEWARNVLNEVKINKKEQKLHKLDWSNHCPCTKLSKNSP